MKINTIIKVSLVSLVVTSLASIEAVKASSETNEKLWAQTTEPSTFDQFRSFIQEAVANPNYRVSYQVESPNQPNLTVQQWFKGNKIRMDTEMQGIQSRMYYVGEETTTCMNQGGNWRCFQLPETAEKSIAGKQGIDKLEDVKNNLESYQNRITKIDSRVIAGEQTSCFQVEEPQNAKYWIACYSNNHGIPLYMEGENSEGTWKMTATSFQTSVSEEEFQFPAEPRSMPNMPGAF